MTNFHFSASLPDNTIIRSETAVSYNEAREQCDWIWRNQKARAIKIYDENSAVFMRIRGFGTCSLGIRYTNR